MLGATAAMLLPLQGVARISGKPIRTVEPLTHALAPSGQRHLLSRRRFALDCRLEHTLATAGWPARQAQAC